MNIYYIISVVKKCSNRVNGHPATLFNKTIETDNMKRIPEFPDYSITEDGKVWSHRRNKFLKPFIRNGYYSINLGETGRNKTIHRIMATLFISNPYNKPCVNHIDGMRTNNSIDNLEWCTYKENTAHAYNTGLAKNMKGSQCGTASLSEDDVIKIKQYIEQGCMLKDIASMFNVHPSTVSDIKRGKSWSHI